MAAGFRHRTSRAGDPQLHTHVLVANLGRGSDGRWTALDGRRLYGEARTASFLYQAVLRSELTRTLRVAWTPVRKGIAEVVGVPRQVLEAFSRRRADIEAALAQRGTSGARAAEAAALATRQRKDPRVQAECLVDEWRARAAALGFGREELGLIIGRKRSRVPNAVVWQRAADDLCAASSLTRRSATFSRGEVLQGLCEALPRGACVDVAALELAAERLLASSDVVPLMPVGEGRDEGAVFRRRDGRVLPWSIAELRYSTRELLTLEARLLDRVMESRRAGAGTATDGAVERALGARPTLSADQREGVDRLCRDGDGVAVLVGKAGTGKTFALAAAREAWQVSGYPVLGVATARRAAAELRDGAGIESTSVAALLGALRRDARQGLPDRCVLVVDEAGMVATRDIAELLGHVEAAGGKLVLVGDHRQLPELYAGGTFRGLVQRGLAIELRENLRQRHAWERIALDHLRERRPEPALALYGAHERLHVEPNDSEARGRLVRDWWQVRDPDRAVMIAHRRIDVADLNALARELMRYDGALGERELILPGGDFAVGDRVVVKRNDLARGVHNGDRGRVLAVDPASNTLTLACGDRVVTLDREFLLGVTADGDPTLLHGYAITGHVAQGLTVDHAFVLAGDGIGREWAYVALSRGRESNHLYVPKHSHDVREEFAPGQPEVRDPIARLAASLRASEAQVLAIDSGTPDGAAAAVARRERAERAVREAARERDALDRGQRMLLPRQRRELEAARVREGAARQTLAEVRRVEAELRHGARPFVGERELQARADRLHERLADRATERALNYDRGIGRER